jgi:hypothetical protein
MVVQTIEQRLKCSAKVGKIHYPAAVLAHVAADVDLYAERMAVNAGTLMARLNMRKPVGRFNLENAKYIHRRIVPPGQPLIKPAESATGTKAGLFVGAVAEWLVGGVTTTAQRTALLDALLAVAVVHSQTTAEGQRAVFDHGNR